MVGRSNSRKLIVWRDSKTDHKRQQQRQSQSSGRRFRRNSRDHQFLAGGSLERRRRQQQDASIYSPAPRLRRRSGRQAQAPTTLLAPHFLLPPGAGPFALAANSTGSAHAGPLAGPQGAGAAHLLPLFGAGAAAQVGALQPGAGQFAALTPDARACVTATYLCVLIVNNTWLDCNLLDTLCSGGGGGGGANNNNNNNGTASRRGQQSSTNSRSAPGEHDDSILRDAQNATEWLARGRRDEFLAERALESALSGLVAFAGGGGGGGAHSADEEAEAGGALRLARARMDDGEGAAAAARGRHVLLLGQRQHQQRQQQADGDDERANRIYLVPVQLAHPSEPDKSRQIPVILHDSGGGGEGGGGDDDGDGASLYVASEAHKGGGQRISVRPSEELDSWVALQQQQQQQPFASGPAKMERLVEEDKSRALEQYFKFRKHQMLKLSGQKRPQQQQQHGGGGGDLSGEPLASFARAGETSNHSNSVNVDAASLMLATTQQPAYAPSTAPAPTTTQSSLVSWVGRPFRGWGAYSLWSSGANSAASNQAEPLAEPPGLAEQQQRQQQQQHHRQQGGVQILRPVDRSEQFNDIMTGSQAKNEARRGQHFELQGDHVAQQQQQHRQPVGHAVYNPAYAPAAEFAAGAPDEGQANPAAIYDYNNQRNQFLQQQQQQQHLFAPPTTLNPMQLTSGEQQQQQQEGALCKCAQINADECRLHCLKLQQAPSAPGGVLVGVAKQALAQEGGQLLASGSNYATQATSALATTAPTTTMASAASQLASASSTSSISTTSGKMNPMDVTFLLYTRYTRDLAQELAHLAAAAAAAADASGGGVPTATSLSAAQAGPNSAGGAGSSHNRAGDSLPSVSDTIDLTNETSLDEARLNSSLPIKIIIHGFGSGGRRPWVTDMVYKLLDYEDVNVIVVDWEKGAVLPNYVQAAGNTRIVGHKIAALIKSINVKFGLTGNRYHLIGFSLGAHVAGFAGMEIRNSTSIARHWINRITGLDPASPLFEGYEANDRLDPTDAQFVDVIHSNGDGVLRGGFGSLQPMGHVDFYPNGGRVQVGCNSVLLSALSDIIYGKWQSLCNHRRALNFFMDSFEFNKCRFRSFSCDSYENYLKGDCFDCGQNNEKCSYMGYLANYSKGRGKMYLTTHEEAPFCANQFMIKIIGSKGHKTHWGKVEVTLVTVDGKNESFWLSSMHSGHQSTTTSSTVSSTASSSSSSSATSASSSIGSSSVGSSSPAASSAATSAAASSLSSPSNAPPGGSSPLSAPSSGASPAGSANSAASSNHELSLAAGGGANQRELSQQSMQSLIVAHPTLMNFTQILLRYTKYKGWIYSGDESWPIDKVFLTDSDGQVKSFCGHQTVLESHIITRLSLEPGNCTVLESVQPSAAAAQVAAAAAPQNGGQGAQQAAVSQQQQQQQQSSPRTPRLLSSLMHHQQGSAGTSALVNADQLHHQQRPQVGQQAPALYIAANQHTVAMQRMLTPHQQFAHQILSF